MSKRGKVVIRLKRDLHDEGNALIYVTPEGEEHELSFAACEIRASANDGRLLASVTLFPDEVEVEDPHLLVRFNGYPDERFRLLEVEDDDMPEADDRVFRVKFPGRLTQQEEEELRERWWTTLHAFQQDRRQRTRPGLRTQRSRVYPRDVVEKAGVPGTTTCPHCDKAFDVTSHRHPTEVVCPHCFVDLQVELGRETVPSHPIVDSVSEVAGHIVTKTWCPVCKQRLWTNVRKGLPSEQSTCSCGALLLLKPGQVPEPLPAKPK